MAALTTLISMCWAAYLSRALRSTLAEKVPALKPYIRRTVYNLNK